MAAAGTVLCDQVVFTSVRSGTGEGYRIIAATPSIQAHEKVEITRRSPSHGGLCGENPEAVGLEAYKLPSGRYAVAYCCHAGSEHTGRGGQRVYTHVAILDRPAWRNFEANPVPVHAALALHVESTGPVLKPLARMEKIAIPLPRPAMNLTILANSMGSPSDMVDCALSAAADLLAGKSLVLMETCNPFRLLEKILLSLPLETREGLDVSAGVKFSPARKMRLAIVSEGEADLQRRTAGLDTQVRRPQDGPSPAQNLFEGWERLLRRWWREGRRQDIQSLTGELCRGISCETLDRVARICEDMDALAELAIEGVRLQLAKYNAARPGSKPEQVLVQLLLQKANERVASLQGGNDSGGP